MFFIGFILLVNLDIQNNPELPIEDIFESEEVAPKPQNPKRLKFIFVGLYLKISVICSFCVHIDDSIIIFILYNRGF